MRMLGSVTSIQISPDGSEKLHAVESAQAIAGSGLEGDRYHHRTGTYSKKHDESREATFIESEALEALARDYGFEITPADSRRNITTRGVALNHLVGREFRVGGAAFRGIRLCEPCGHLEEMTGHKVRAGLVHRGGLRAQIIHSGLVKVGDALEAD